MTIYNANQVLLVSVNTTANKKKTLFIMVRVIMRIVIYDNNQYEYPKAGGISTVISLGYIIRGLRI